MTRRDYESLAAVIKAEFIAAQGTAAGAIRSARLSAISQLARALAEDIAKGNKAFSVQLFLYNCGVTV